MREPIKYRNRIPFYYDKSPGEFRKDPYERYDPMVLRQSMIHLSDDLWGSYPFQSVLDYILNHIEARHKNILEVGCGVGRCIADLAMQFPNANCWGIDYSYQMLKMANDVWVDKNSIAIDLSRFGFADELNQLGSSINNLEFGLARCESLPFDDDSQDLVFSSFLLDRLDDPILGLLEMKRVLRSEGRIVLVTPLNFNSASNWNRFYPAHKLRTELEHMGLEILESQEDIVVQVPMDARGNMITWTCVGIVCTI